MMSDHGYGFKHIWRAPRRCFGSFWDYGLTPQGSYLWNRSRERGRKNPNVIVLEQLSGEIGRVEGFRFIRSQPERTVKFIQFSQVQDPNSWAPLDFPTGDAKADEGGYLVPAHFSSVMVFFYRLNAKPENFNAVETVWRFATGARQNSRPALQARLNNYYNQMLDNMKIGSRP